VKLTTLFRRFWIVAAAVAVVCALQALPGAIAAVAADGGGEGAGGAPGPAAGAPGALDAALAPAPGGENTMSSRAERRRIRRWQRTQRLEGAGVDGGAPHDGGWARILPHDGGVRPSVPAPPIVARPTPPAPPPPPPGPAASSATLPLTDLGFNSCRKISSGKRVVKPNLKPDIDLPELVAWISSITCKTFVLPGHLSAGGKKITLITQGMMTPREAYAAFLSALDSVGLTVEKGPGYYRIIETAKAKSSSMPVYGFDGRPTER
jgi:hypothetical protein